MHFDPFAEADHDADGLITMEELGEVNAPAGSVPSDVERVVADAWRAQGESRAA